MGILIMGMLQLKILVGTYNLRDIPAFRQPTFDFTSDVHYFFLFHNINPRMAQPKTVRETHQQTLMRRIDPGAYFRPGVFQQEQFSMNPLEPELRSYIIKIRLEKAPNSSQRNWYGWITRVPEGGRLYFRSLEKVFFIIAQDLNRLGVNVGWIWYIQKLLYDSKESQKLAEWQDKGTSLDEEQ
jgi:hypothetical protein